MQKNNEKQTAIKLLNHYADEYHILEDQITVLKKENIDLKSNLQINKEIIQGFFQKSTIDDKVNLFIGKLKEENKLINTRLQSKEKELATLKAKVASCEQITNTQLNMFKDELEKTKTKSFVYENIIIEKESIIQSLNKRLKKGQGNDSGEKTLEIYIAQPNDIINKLNDRLELYQDINTKLSAHIKTLKTAMVKNERMLHIYEADNEKYKKELNAYKQQKNNSIIMGQLGQSSLGRVNTAKSNNTSDNQSYINSSKLNKSANNFNYDHISTDHMMSKSKRTVMKEIEKLEEINKNKQSINQFDLTEEWYETLKHCGLTQEEYVRYCKNKQMMKLTDVIEYLYKLIIDKNIQIKLLNENNDCLNGENLMLNRFNIELTDELEALKCNNKDSGENSTSQYSHRKKGADTSTFVNVDERNRDDCPAPMNYVAHVMNSISSSEFREGMVLDQFDLASEISKQVGYIDTLEQNGDNIKISTNI